MAILLCFFYGKKQACHKTAQILRIFSFNDGFTKSFAHIFRDVVQFSCRLRKFYDIFLIFLQKSIDKKKNICYNTGYGVQIFLQSKGRCFAGKDEKAGFYKTAFAFVKGRFSVNNDFGAVKFEFAPGEIEALADFVMQLNGRLSFASMFCPNRREQLLGELAFAADDGLLAVSTAQGKFAAACWVYPDDEHENADVNLFVAEEFLPCFCKYAAKVFGAVRKKLAFGTKYTFYFPKQNEALFSFLEEIGAVRSVDEFGLLLRREDVRGLVPSFAVTELSPCDYEEFAKLHDEVFPDVYVSGKGVLKTLGTRRRVFVLKESGVLTAYSVLENKSEKRLCAEIVGVKDGFRHCGRGRTVLSRLIEEAFSDPGVRLVDLIVDCDNENALKLYFDLGFKVEFENRNFTFR